MPNEVGPGFTHAHQAVELLFAGLKEIVDDGRDGEYAGSLTACLAALAALHGQSNSLFNENEAESFFERLQPWSLQTYPSKSVRSAYLDVCALAYWGKPAAVDHTFVILACAHMEDIAYLEKRAYDLLNEITQFFPYDCYSQDEIDCFSAIMNKWRPFLGQKFRKLFRQWASILQKYHVYKAGQ